MFKVIVIDDETFVRKGIVLETDWNAMNCIVVAEAENGVEGLEIVRKFQPDLLICDIKMPKMDGIQILRQLREEKNDVKVIFLTAYGEFEYAQSACKLFASDYLLKPFQDGELENAVLRVTEKISKEQGRNSQEDKEEGIPKIVLKSGDKSKYVMGALYFISEHYSDCEISVGMIAESLGISADHLSHIFKKETDYTVMAYITRFRMHNACKLLGNCRYKVYEVAERVGYRDIAYFSSIFKKTMGVTPSEYQDRSI